jgi:hypothetical protein
MTLENLEAEVLLLPKQSQVVLLARMLERLGKSNENDQDVASVWVEEAESRDRAMDDSQVAGIPAEQVFQRIRTSLPKNELKPLATPTVRLREQTRGCKRFVATCQTSA